MRPYITNVIAIDIEHWPELHDPALVVALSGWVDAGVAGAGTIQVLRDQLPDADRFGALDLTDLMDLQQSRPVAVFPGDGNRVIDWPQIDLVAGHLGRDIVIVSGPEPSLRWSDVTKAIVDVALRLGVRDAFTVAGMPALVSHRRAVPVLATATHRSLAQELAPLRMGYMGPTGMQ